MEVIFRRKQTWVFNAEKSGWKSFRLHKSLEEMTQTFKNFLLQHFSFSNQMAKVFICVEAAWSTEDMSWQLLIALVNQGLQLFCWENMTGVKFVTVWKVCVLQCHKR